MSKLKQHLIILAILMGMSFVMFMLHFIIFGQLYNTIYYSAMNICFIPVNILIATFVFEEIVARNTKADRLSKLGMLIGVFFSDIGFELLNLIIAGDEKLKYLRLDFSDLKECKGKFKLYKHEIDFDKIDSAQIKNLVINSRDILTMLISNESVSEHERFSDLLMVLMHLRDEIMFMGDGQLTDQDKRHIEGDLGRVYKALSIEWTSYLNYLKQSHPYQYSSALRINPFRDYSK